MEFQELKVLTAIYECGGFKKASEHLGLTQSAVSQSLANLERKLGEKLVLRNTPVQLTPIGKELLQHANFILERERIFLSDLDRLKLGHLQKLNLCVDDLVNEYYCSTLIKKIHQRLPEASFRIKHLPAREMITAVTSGEFELGFGPFQKNMDGLKKIKAFTEEVVLVANKSHPYLKSKKGSHIDFLKSSPLLTSHLDEPSKRPSKKKIREYFNNVWEVDNISLQIKLVSQNLGVTFLPQTLLKKHPLAKGFVILKDIPFSTITKPYGVYYSSKTQLSQVAKSFIEQLET